MSSTADRIGDVVTMPARAISSQAATIASSAAGGTWPWQAQHVDDWGRDNAFVDRIWSLSRMRWSISVGGTEHVPRRAGALIAVNSRRFALAPVFAALAIGAETGRAVRFVGRPDWPPVGPVMQRLGALLALEDELEGALRAGELIVLGAEHCATNRRCGVIDHRLVGAAVAARTRVLACATASVPGRRNARVEISPPVSKPRRRGPLAELELADRLQDRVDEVLDELGGTLTGTPLDWLTGGIGGL